MPPAAALIIVLAPLAIFAVVAIGIRETPARTVQSDRFAWRGKPPYLSLALALIAVFMEVSDPTRANDLAFILIMASLVGGIYMQHKVAAIFTHITRFYLEPGAWPMCRHRGQHWRYEMQHVYRDDPEHLDALMLEMIRENGSYQEFRRALNSLGKERSTEEPDTLTKRFWGPFFPTVYNLAVKVVPNELLGNSGRYRSPNTAEKIYNELRELALIDSKSFLDRWQYYWCLRNLNLIEKLLLRTCHPFTQLAAIALGALVFWVGTRIDATYIHQPTLPLTILAAGSLLWLVITCGGASLLIVGAFRGTGTFTISYPARGVNFDPLWSKVIEVGILAFAVSFVIYGVGSPFLFEPKTLEQFSVDWQFAAYAAASFLFCGSVFVAHFIGVHNLMSKSRDNALSRTSDALLATKTQDSRTQLMERFIDLRNLRTWPIRAAVVLQLAGGIALPVMVQAILLYTGLKAK